MVPHEGDIVGKKLIFPDATEQDSAKHHTRHEPGGDDEVTGISPAPHAADHENGGGDEMSLAGLDGEPSALTSHKGNASAHHAKTGDNEVYGLVPAGLASGRPAAGVAGRWYFSTDTLVLERDNGTAWVEMARGETAIRLAQLSEKAHSSLTGVTSDQHHARYTDPEAVTAAKADPDISDAIAKKHAQAHTLASHSSKNHSELTGVSADQHHARQHDHSQAADGNPIAVAGVPNLPASKITSGRFGMPRMPDGASGKFLKATGVGNNPAYADVTFLGITDTPSTYNGQAQKALVVNDAENAVEFADPIPKATDWKGSFNWDTSAYGTSETDISALFSTNLAETVRRKYTVYLDLTNVAADGNFDELYLAVKVKIDGTNYRAIDRKTVTAADIVATAEPGIIIEIPAAAENVQITMTMGVALASDRVIYYAVVKEHLE